MLLASRGTLAALPLPLSLEARLLLLLLALALARAALFLGAPGGLRGLVLFSPFGLDLVTLQALFLREESRDRDEDFRARRLLANARDDLRPHGRVRVRDDGREPARVREEHAREDHLARLAGRVVRQRQPVVVAFVVEAVRGERVARQRLGGERAQKLDVSFADLLRLLHRDDAVAKHADGAHRAKDLIRRFRPPKEPAGRARRA